MKIPLRTKILIIVIAIILTSSLNFFQKKVKNFFYLISEPIQKVLWQAGMNTSDFFEAILEVKNLKKENEGLKLKIQELLSENSSLKELRKENEILREALNIGLAKEFQLNLSQIIGKDVSRDSILINKGLKDGIKRGFPVITPEKTLVGKISEVFDNFSKVILITDKENSFDAKVVDSGIYGVIKGKGNFQAYLDLIPKNEEIKEGDLLITTSLGGIFPPGLLVGKVKEVKKLDIEPFQQAEIELAFDIKNLDFLFIITNF